MIPVYVDCETTGLDPQVHHAYEYAWAVASDDVRTLYVPHTLDNAEPVALQVGQYFERGFRPFSGNQPTELWWEALQCLQGATLIGANVGFDAGFMRYRIFGYAPWKYRLLDVESMAVGVLGLDEPKGLKWLADTLMYEAHRRHHDQEIPEPDHTAAGDVRTVRAVHLALEQIRAVRLGHGVQD